MATFATPGFSDVGNEVEHTIRSGEQSFELARGEGSGPSSTATPIGNGCFTRQCASSRG